MIRTVASVSLALVLLAGCGADGKSTTPTGNSFLGGDKQPWEYTLEEFRAMSDEDQVAFRNSFESLDAFYAWVDSVQSVDVKNPWDNTGAKKPEDYTWEEFEALTAEQQIAFQNSFSNFEEFEDWLQKVQSHNELNPWEMEGGKQSSEYTWAEFEALTAEQQIAFQNSFNRFEDFEAWMNSAQVNSEKNPWDMDGVKQPSEYTWAEFEALTGEQQIAFQNSFVIFEDFEAWLQSVQGGTVASPWKEAGAKQPKDYTWAEFEALTGEQQMAFQSSFDNQDAFDAWLQKNMPQETEATVRIPWENGGKQPKDYTWAEFEALSGELQMIFQNSFDSFEAFDAWLQRVNP